MYCVCTEREEMVKLLLEHHARTDVVDKFMKTALHYSVTNTDRGCMNSLIEAGNGKGGAREEGEGRGQGKKRK